MWIVRLALRRPYTFVVVAILILILGVLTIACWWAPGPFHYGCYVLLLALAVSALILFLKPMDYSDHDIEVTGLYWHFVDLVWMLIFPLVYLMSTRITG